MTGIGVAAWLGGLSIPVLVAIVFVVMVAVSLGGHGIRPFQNALGRRRP